MLIKGCGSNGSGPVTLIYLLLMFYNNLCPPCLGSPGPGLLGCATGSAGGRRSPHGQEHPGRGQRGPEDLRGLGPALQARLGVSSTPSVPDQGRYECQCWVIDTPL